MVGSALPAVVDQDVKDVIQQETIKQQETGQRDLTTAEIERKRMQSQMLRLNNEFGILNCPDGDTLAYIGPPPQTPSESQTWDNAYLQNHFSLPHRVHSSKFLGLSAKRFNDLFGPRSLRTERRFRKEGILSHVSTKGIKFFVDLQPPTEDEEAVVLLTSLTCTKGILTWHTAQDKYLLSPMLVAGQDDSSSIPVDFHLPITLPEDKTITLSEDKKASKDHKPVHSKRLSNAEKEPWDKEKFDSREDQYEDGLFDCEAEDKDAGLQNAIASSIELPALPVDAPESPPPKSTSPKTSIKKPTKTKSEHPEKPMIISPEYSSLRHRSAVERLVHAIENGDPKLDSAPKVWTFFAVAKYFDCASHERISGWIMNWLISYPNSNFIQSNPEVTLRIGLGTQSENVTKDAFSILVGEKSLLNVFGESCPAILSPLVQSVHGRKLELLDDDERNRIDHAAASLVRRIRQKFDELVGREMAWLQQSSQYRKLFSLVPRDQEEVDVVNNLIQKVKHFVRGRIIWVLCRTYEDDFSDFEQALKKVRTFYPGTRDTFRETYNKLNERERIFTRFFWVALNQETLGDGAVNLWTERITRLGLPEAGGTYLSQKMLDWTMPDGERLCQIVSRKEVTALITQFNQIGRIHMAVDGQIRKQTMFQNLPQAIAPQHGISVRAEQTARPAKQETPSAWSYDSSGFKASYTTSPKREQIAIPSKPLTDKRRKLSDAAVGAGMAPTTSSALESLPIRLRVADFFHRTDNVVHTTRLGSTVHQTDSAPSCNRVIDAEAKENVTPQLSQGFVPLVDEAKDNSGAEEFGHDDFRTRNFQPNLPNLLSGGLSMKDPNFHQHITDMPRKPRHSAEENDNRVRVMASEDYPIRPEQGNPRHSAEENDNRARVMASEDYPIRPEQGNQDRGITAADYSYDTDNGKPGPVITAADYSYDTDDGKPGPVVTPADWSLQAEDVYWDERWQIRDYTDTQSRHSQQCYLRCDELLHDVSNVLHRICDEIINPAHLFHGDNLLPTNLIDTLMCLNDDEWKYLPLWAGGNDDGTGGVFDEVDVPNLEAGGFKGGRRGIGSVSDGKTSSSISESSFDDIGSEGISTVGKASKAATDGTQTVKSLSDIGSEDEGFMRQNELWDEIRNMKVDGAGSVGHENGVGADKGEAGAEYHHKGFDSSMHEQDADDVDTIVGAGSTDGDDDVMDAEEELGLPGFDDEGSEDDDMEIINMDDL
jgi:hypothetical protein